jgi:peptidyl-prolyl cis-trans isomerase SurA
VSGIVPTRFGFHIIEAIERDGDNLHARHILARVMPGPDDDARAMARAESLRQRVIGGEDFAAIAEQYSDDPSTGGRGGALGWFTVDQLAPDFRDALSGLSPGGISPVVRGDGGHYVLKLLDHEESRIAELDEVREDMREYLFAVKAEEAYEALIDRLSAEIFVDVRTEMVPRE